MTHVVVQKVSFLLISQSTAVGSTQSTLPGVFRVGRKWGATIFRKNGEKGAFAFSYYVLYLIFLVGFKDHLVRGASKSWLFNPPKAVIPHGDAQHNVAKKKLTGMV